MERHPTRPATSASQWSVEGYVTQERLRRNLEQPRTTLVWELQHSSRPGTAEPLALDQFSRTTGRFHVKGVMSPLTVQQNERLETLTSAPTPSIPVTAPVSPSSRAVFAPSERDYKRLIDRLEKLASARAAGSNREQLKESKDFECTLEEGETQFCFINVRRRAIPLRIRIRRARGKVKLLVSKTTPEPSENSCEETHRGDNVVLAEPGLKFKFQCYYVGFKAVEDTTFVVNIAFGRDKAEDEVLMRRRQFKSQSSGSNLDELRLDEALKQELKLKVGVILQHRKVNSAQFTQKDYVEMNKRILSPQSPERTTLANSKSLMHLQRISTAQSRKRENMDLKKQRTLLAINRHKLRVEEEDRLRKLKEHREKKSQCEANWLALLVLANCTADLVSRFLARKALIQLQEQRNSASFHIERLVRRRYRGVKGKDLARSQGLSCFRLFVGLAGPLLKVQGGKAVVQHLRASARNNLVQDSFKSFYRRITLIQHMWRLYVLKDKERWKTIIDQWGKGIETILNDANKKWPGKKGAKKRQEIMDKYLGLPVSSRNLVLRNYFKAYKMRYREQVRTYIAKSYHSGAFKAAKAFQSLLLRSASSEDLVLAPAFNYLPSEDCMRDIIEQAVTQGVAER